MVVTKTFAVIQLPVKNVEESAKWYCDILGVNYTFKFTPGDNEAWLNVGGIGLGLIQSPKVPNLDFTNMDGVTQPIISIQVENIHDAYQELQAKQVEVGEMVYKRGGGYSFTFRDPDGHIANLWGGWPSAEDELANQ